MKNKLVKYLFFLGSFILVVNMSFSTTYASTDLTDINGSYAKDAIKELQEAGIIQGDGNGQFNPTGKISRQDFAIILAKALNLDTTEAPATATFSDVPASHYSFQYVEAAVKAGLIQGIGSGAFGLGQNLTREQMAVFYVRALGTDTAGLGNSLPFSDASGISDWAKDAVGTAVQFGLISGLPNGSFNPTGAAERQQVALVASKFLKVNGELNPPVNNPNPPEEDPTPSVDNQNPNPNPNPNQNDDTTGGEGPGPGEEGPGEGEGPGPEEEGPGKGEEEGPGPGEEEGPGPKEVD